MEEKTLIKFLEETPLYTRLPVEPNELENTVHIPNVNINLYCKICKDIRTFELREKAIFFDNGNYFVSVIEDKSSSIEPNDRIFFRYTCASCKDFDQDFLIRIGESREYLHKIGQYPEWSIRIDKYLKEILGKYAKYYEMGTILESHGQYYYSQMYK